MNPINAMLDAIPNFADESQIELLRTAIEERFPPNSNAVFDNGLDKLWALFGDLL